MREVARIVDTPTVAMSVIITRTLVSLTHGARDRSTIKWAEGKYWVIGLGGGRPSSAQKYTLPPDKLTLDRSAWPHVGSGMKGLHPPFGVGRR